MSELIPLADARRELIRGRLREGRPVKAAELAAEFAVSEDTVRRDLRDLARAGECRRVYGGALPLSPAGGNLTERRREAPGRKRLIAEAVIPLIPPGSTVFIDAGSTNVQVASLAWRFQPRTVITNAPSIAAVLSENGVDEIVVIGGRLDPATGSCLGSRTLREVEGLAPDVVILGGCGIAADAGVTVFSSEEAEIKRTVAATSRAVIVTSTREKLGTAAPFAIMAASRVSALVVEADAEPREVERFSRLGVAVTRAAPATFEDQ
ncbi:transcriptional regulator, DeoR family [Consotaella salsifontis]|uniref:Transcriptional regulator, DeoR family n=2 Tax=Consotaella salsifontis TaxID=1365950 RepID=A0A1T4SQJ9_9HYPH|nr:transcriptional regulator, DeoR family [Consotaella salsifontis]